MALIGKGTTFSETIFGTLAFDATLTEEPISNAVITSNPVEIGAEINDHFYLEPKIFTFTAGVTDTPLRVITNDIVEANSNIFGSSTEGDLTRKESALAVLEALQASAQPFKVQCGLKSYENMVITNISATRQRDNAGALIFSATLQEVLIVETETAILPAAILEGATKNRGTSKTDAGRKKKETTSNQSILFQSTEAIRKTISELAE